MTPVERAIERADPERVSLLVQLLMLPVGIGRIYHDFIGYVTVEYVLGRYVEDVEIRRVGYRYRWRADWRDDTPAGKIRIAVMAPTLVGMLVANVLWPSVWLAQHPPSAIPGLSTGEWVLLYVLATNLLAFIVPSVDDYWRWQLANVRDPRRDGAAVSGGEDSGPS